MGSVMVSGRALVAKPQMFGMPLVLATSSRVRARVTEVAPTRKRETKAATRTARVMRATFCLSNLLRCFFGWF
jgi:hypothetical protein